MNSRNGAHAVVLGGSMAGLFAARVLAEHYDQVTIVERDEVVGVRGPRSGAPHTVHAHGLHARGHLAVEEFFPGITKELQDAGIPTGDLGEMRWFFNARRIQPAHTGLLSVTAPRPVLEAHVRARVVDLPNVQVLQRHDVLAPVAAPGGGSVRGVTVRPRAEGADAFTLDADVVVDATGRGSRTPAWLEAMGYKRPEEERVRVGLAYTTRHYRTRPGMFDGVQSINPVATPDHPRGAFFGQVGPDTCILSLTGLLGDHPPTDHEGFLEFTRSLPVPDVYEAMHDAEALDEPVRFTFPASQRRRYERLDRFPSGLLVIGDALCSFNPVYGQGMSVAALQATALRDRLRKGDAEPAGFLSDVARVIDAPWEVSAGGDLDFPGVEGHRTTKIRVGNAYVARLQYAATKDARLTEAFMRVAGLMDPPTALMRPRTVARVLRHAVRRPPAGVARRAAGPKDRSAST
ncbi:FAD-dependent oxidoreductase [Actinomadura flavalba]|uniref:FAD-dependent oxidoreductase n=1 Tax=Actinomadura flavalba TaxID=1120938 RepID=UPI0003A644ED|nr:FAD-dependent oxidoreductase [Actinomadura flavalba]